MLSDNARMTDAIEMAFGRARELVNDCGLVGYGIVELRGPDGKLKLVQPFANLITTVGDQYYATRAVAGIGTPNIVQPTLATRMKLGTGVTAAVKSGAGAVLVTWLNTQLFDTTHPTVTVVTPGTDVGWNATYKTTWAAGTATNAAITEATISTDTTNTVGLAADTISRTVFTAVPKGALDSLAITWSHKFLGA